MARAINMPQVGQDIKTARIVQWHVKEGDAVNRGDIVATVESDKASFEVEAFEEGVILQLLYAEGDEAKVFDPIATIGEPGQQPEKTDAGQQPETILASPVVRRMAGERNIPLHRVSGSGPGGRIIKKDLVAFIDAQEVTGDQKKKGNGPDQVIEFSRMRKRIAERLMASKQQIPHFYLFNDVDVTDLLSWRSKTSKDLNTRVSVNDMIVKICAEVLQEYPRLNAHVDRDKLIVKKQINIGIAVSVEDGLLVPVIPDTDKKTITEIGEISRRNAENARRGILGNPAAGTFTVSNLGMYGINLFQGIINPPECAILSIGAIEKKVVPFEHGIAVRDYVTLGLACDHRAVDGAYAASFMDSMKTSIQSFDENKLTIS